MELCADCRLQLFWMRDWVDFARANPFKELYLWTDTLMETVRRENKTIIKS